MLEGTCEEEVHGAFLLFTEFVCVVPVFSRCLANVQSASTATDEWQLER